MGQLTKIKQSNMMMSGKEFLSSNINTDDYFPVNIHGTQLQGTCLMLRKDEVLECLTALYIWWTIIGTTLVLCTMAKFLT